MSSASAWPPTIGAMAVDNLGQAPAYQIAKSSVGRCLDCGEIADAMETTDPIKTA